MKKLALSVVLLVLTAVAFSQTIVAYHAVIQTHGGWPTTVNIGADKGDVSTVRVTCDHTNYGTCLTGAPKLSTGEVFTQLPGGNETHQEFQIVVPRTGNEVFTLNYWWVGADVHYTTTIQNIEAASK